MKAYIIVDVKITNPGVFEEYKKLTPATLVPFEGNFIVRGGGDRETLEGEWNSERIVVIEFPSKQKAKDWWSSDGYAPAKALRQTAAKAKMILVEGV
jgi:uncharacterized protein (DUF1330 family)